MHSWDFFLKKLEKKFGASTVDTWLRSLKIIKFDARNIYLLANDLIHVNWFEEQIRPLLHELLNNNGQSIEVHINLASDQKKPTKIVKEQLRLYEDELEPWASLEHFYPPEESLVTYRLLCELCGFQREKLTYEEPKQKLSAFNPIFIYGPNGSGKTHLLMASCKALKKIGYKTMYVRASTFASHFVTAIRLSQMEPFRQKYRDLDVLIVDDIQDLTRKQATQEEFFHTYNYLYQNNSQIILSASMCPSHLKEIEPRLISRFEWGLLLRLDTLDKSNCYKTIKSLLSFYNLPSHDDFVLFFQNSFGNLTRIHQAIKKAKEALSKNLAQISLKDVEVLLQSFIEKEKSLAINSEDILQIICEFFEIKKEDLLGSSHQRVFSRPRQLAMYYCRDLLRFPFMKIGSLFQRDHSTVMSSIKSIQNSLQDQRSKTFSDHLAIQEKLNKLKH